MSSKLMRLCQPSIAQEECLQSSFESEAMIGFGPGFTVAQTRAVRLVDGLRVLGRTFTPVGGHHIVTHVN